METFLKCAVSGRLGRYTVGLLVRDRAGCAARPLGQHQSRSQNRSVVIVLLMYGLASLALLIVLLQQVNGGSLLGQHVDQVRHGEVVQAVAPRHLQNDIGPDQVVTGI